MDQIFSDTNSEPEVPLVLLKYIQDQFPLEAFKNVSSERELYRYQGAQDVIDFLQVLYERQNNRFEE